MSDGYMWSALTHIPQTETNWATTTREPQSDLDRTAFLNLLITQLRHQDPMNPMEDRDFVAQMAQFSALEQMVNLNTTFERSQAFGMIGKIIDAEFFNPVSEEWVEIEGRFVTSVTRQGDRVFLTVLGDDGNPIDVLFDSVREVSEDFFVTQQLYDIFANIHGQRATDLIGRHIQAITMNGENATFVEGEVTSVKLAGSQAVLVVGNREVFLHEVFSVADNYMLLNSPHFTHGDRLTGVEIHGNRAYLIFDNNPSPDARIQIQRINHATEALVYVGAPIDYSGVRGTVESITIRGGIPFLDVRTSDGELEQIDFLNYLVSRAEGNTATNNTATTTPPTTP